jgi:hypothetical protein
MTTFSMTPVIDDPSFFVMRMSMSPHVYFPLLYEPHASTISVFSAFFTSFQHACLTRSSKSSTSALGILYLKSS